MRDPGYIPYKEWIKSYKPYFTVQTSPLFIEDWIEQANAILEYIESNIN